MVSISSGSFVKTINNATNQSTWTEQINLWQWMAEIITSDEYNNQSIKIWDYIEYKIKDRVVYAGFVVDIDRYIEERITNIKYYVRWLGTVLRDVLAPWFNSSVEDPTLWIVSAMEAVNASYDFFNIEVKPSWITTQENFFWEIAQDRIDKVLGILSQRTWWYDYFVYPDGTFKCSDEWDTVHNLTIGREIDSFDINERGSEIFNKYAFFWRDMDNDNNPTYIELDDLESQFLYGLRTRIEYDTKMFLNNISLAENFWNNVLARNAQPKLSASMVVNAKYDLFDLHPWDFVNIMGLDLDLPNIRIERLQYQGEKVVLYFEVLESFISLIKS